LIISYNEAEDQPDYIKEYVDDLSARSFYYGDLIVNDYFDDEGLRLIEDSYELGES